MNLDLPCSGRVLFNDFCTRGSLFCEGLDSDEGYGEYLFSPLMSDFKLYFLRGIYQDMEGKVLSALE